jgi:hypothetical protein
MLIGKEELYYNMFFFVNRDEILIFFTRKNLFLYN